MLTDTFYTPPTLGKYLCPTLCDASTAFKQLLYEAAAAASYSNPPITSPHPCLSLTQEGGNDGVRLFGATSKTGPPILKRHGLTYLCLSLTSHMHTLPAQTWNTLRVQTRPQPQSLRLFAPWPAEELHRPHWLFIQFCMNTEGIVGQNPTKFCTALP